VGYSDKVRGVDGKNYMVSTAQKFDTWESAVFQAGMFGVMLGKGLCFAEATLGDRPGEALVAHTRTVGMVALLPRGRWEMSAAEIRSQQSDAAEYVTAPKELKALMVALLRNRPSVNAIRDNNVYGPGTNAVLVWLDTALHMDQEHWGKALQAASADQGWSDPATFTVAASLVEADAGLRAGITLGAAASGLAAARAGATNEQEASFILAFFRNAAVALLTRHAIPDAVFTKLYAPFAEAIPLRGASSPSVQREPSESSATKRPPRLYRPPAGERPVTDDEVSDALLEHLIPKPAAKSLGVSRRTVEARLENPEFRLRYWPREIVRRVEVDFALRVLKVQSAEDGLDMSTIQGAFAEGHETAVRAAADAYKAASNDGSSDEVGTTDSAQAAVEGLLVNQLKTLKGRDGRNWVLGPEDTEEEVRAFYDQLYRGTLE